MAIVFFPWRRWKIWKVKKAKWQNKRLQFSVNKFLAAAFLSINQILLSKFWPILVEVVICRREQEAVTRKRGKARQVFACILLTSNHMTSSCNLRVNFSKTTQARAIWFSLWKIYLSQLALEIMWLPTQTSHTKGETIFTAKWSLK